MSGGGENTREKAMGKALRLLAFRARSRHEMQSRLAESGFSGESVNAVIGRLEELGYIDDGAFAANWARHLAVNRLYGNIRIEASLREKGLSRELIAEAVEGTRAELGEKKRIGILVRKKIGDRPPSALDRAGKRRLARFLAGKGYRTGLIHDVFGMTEEDFEHEGE
ncbi:MAG TPA: RecX family transcriptional regulator [Syntrophales bacterium]|nr:RecX family transcriptional regulator [Syntrophales bacterium]